MSKSRLSLATFVIVFLVVLSPSATLQVARASGPWYVATTGNDNLNDCLTPSTPCGSVNGALAKPGFTDGDTVKVSIGTYYGTGNEVVLLNRSATLSGGWDASFTAESGMSTIDGQEARRGVTVSTDVTGTISQFSVQHGNWNSYWPGGGGIYNNGTLTLNNNEISNNISAKGGGIFNDYGNLVINGNLISKNNGNNYEGGGILNAYGTMKINQSTVEDNTAGQGGGIFTYGPTTINNSTISRNIGGVGSGIYSGGNTAINNSTISGNTASRYGGGIYHFNWGNLVISSSSITANKATESGGGLYYSYGYSSLRNTLIAGNSAAYSPDCMTEIEQFTSVGFNLIGDVSGCSFSLTVGDRVNVSAALGPLQDNGGNTFTHALTPSSAAIDAGNPAGCFDNVGNLLGTDQRGAPRDGRCDIGAFQFQGDVVQTFIPWVARPVPTPTQTPVPTPTPPPFYGIEGHITSNGVHLAGVAVELRFFNGSTWYTSANATTNADGIYSFPNAPSLVAGQFYYARYTNSSDPNRLCCWFTRMLSSYTAGTTVAIGDFDIANIQLQSPNPGATISVYVPFQWATRNASPSDSYEFNLFDPYNANTYWYSPHLGFVGSYSINHSLPGFNPHQLYGWYVGVYSPDGGYGESYYARGVYFDDTIQPGSQPQILKPRNIPGSNERRLPTLQRSR